MHFGERKNTKIDFLGEKLGFTDAIGVSSPQKLFHFCGQVVAKRVDMAEEIAVLIRSGLPSIWFRIPTGRSWPYESRPLFDRIRKGDIVAGIVQDDLPKYRSLRSYGISGGADLYMLKKQGDPDFFPLSKTIWRITEITGILPEGLYPAQAHFTASVQTTDGAITQATLKLPGHERVQRDLTEWNRIFAGHYVAGWNYKPSPRDRAEAEWPQLGRLPDHLDLKTVPFRVAEDAVPAPGGDLSTALFGDSKPDSKFKALVDQARTIFRPSFEPAPEIANAFGPAPPMPNNAVMLVDLRPRD